MATALLRQPEHSPKPRPRGDVGLDPRLASALGPHGRTPSHVAAASANIVLQALLGAEVRETPHVGVSREGSVVFTFNQGSRFASYECDSDGDVIFTLNDVDTDTDAPVQVLRPIDVRSSLPRAFSFLTK
jgi:hypothetical protein